MVQLPHQCVVFLQTVVWQWHATTSMSVVTLKVTTSSLRANEAGKERSRSLGFSPDLWSWGAHRVAPCPGLIRTPLSHHYLFSFCLWRGSSHTNGASTRTISGPLTETHFHMVSLQDVSRLCPHALSLLPVFRACLSLRFLASRRWQELWRLTI